MIYVTVDDLIFREKSTIEEDARRDLAMALLQVMEAKRVPFTPEMFESYQQVLIDCYGGDLTTCLIRWIANNVGYGKGL